jgi:hypothetical protein
MQGRITTIESSVIKNSNSGSCLLNIKGNDCGALDDVSGQVHGHCSSVLGFGSGGQLVCYSNLIRFRL